MCSSDLSGGVGEGAVGKAKSGDSSLISGDGGGPKEGYLSDMEGETEKANNASAGSGG